MKFIRAKTLAWLTLGACLALGQAHAADDPVVGKWFIPSFGEGENASPLGFEIRRDTNGETQAFLYYPILNLYGVQTGRPVLTTGDRYKVTGDTIEFSSGPGDTLILYRVDEKPLSLKRTASMPERPPAPALPPAPEPTWRVRLGGAIYAAPTVRDGIAYLGNVDGVFFAIKMLDGSVVWSFPAGRSIYGQALATDDAVFFACDNGYLFKLNRADGKEVWRYDLGDSQVSRIPPNPYVFDYDQHGVMPLLVDGILYLGAGDGGFHAVAAADGKRLWRIQSNGKIRTSAARHEKNAIFATMNGWVSAVDLLTGKEAWSNKMTSAYTSGPAVFEDIVIVGDRGSNVRALDAKTGSERWSKNHLGSWIESTAVFRDGRAYIGSGDLFTVSSFDPRSGTSSWRTNVGGWVMQRPAVTEKMVYAGVSGARRRIEGLYRQTTALTAIDRATGDIAWSWAMPEWPGAFLGGFFAAPAVTGDTLLAAGIDGTLYAFPIK